ncbi:ISNCY family transposase ISAcif1 [subsurface metagenome]
MIEREHPATIQCGRLITERELDQIRETVELFPQLARSELAETICEHLEWFTAGGTGKVDACLKLLQKLEAAGRLKLSEKQKAQGNKMPARRVALTAQTDPRPEIASLLKELGVVELQVVKEKEERALWNEYVERYHPLHYKKPFGYRLRYFIDCKQGSLGCLLFSGAAKALGARDSWIGWTEEQRLRNQAWVINNSRFLIFPWVKVKNLSSHVLGQLARRIAEDWDRRWGYRPVLIETFVDPQHREGSCYKAAGWQYLGMTTGEGLVREGKIYTTSPKMIFVKPLVKEFQSLLCSAKALAAGWGGGLRYE